MENKELISLLNLAKSKIESQQATINIQATRLQMFDDVMTIFRSEPPRQGMSEMGPNPIYHIEKMLAVLSGEDKAVEK
jgi:hypothetical protein